MPKPTPYTGRSIDELAALPSQAPVTIAELCEWRQHSLSKYHRDRVAGLIPAPVYYGTGSPRHTAADMRGDSEQQAA